MVQMTVNSLAVLAAAVANMVLGMLWYGPVFGKEWMRLMGITADKIDEAKKKGMGKSYAAAFVSALVTAYVMALFVELAGAATLMEGAQVAFWAWLGFVAAVATSSVLWEGRPLKLYFLNVGYSLASFLIMGMLMAVWK